MATLVPLPSVSELPRVVIFHREAPSEPVLIMQVPTGDTEDFATYNLRLDNAEHKRWIGRLPGARDLAYKLTYEPHLAYFPHEGGACMALEDVEEPSVLRKVIAGMRARPTPERTDAMFQRRRLQAPGVSAVRMALGRRRGSGML